MCVIFHLEISFTYYQSCFMKEIIMKKVFFFNISNHEKFSFINEDSSNHVVKPFEILNFNHDFSCLLLSFMKYQVMFFLVKSSCF